MVATVLNRANPAVTEGTLWTIDARHSSITFSVKHMKIATVHGRFDRFGGTIRFDRDRPARTEVAVEIDAASIDTGIGKRDDHLRSPDFFDIAECPFITFRSLEVEPISSFSLHSWRMSGTLTIHGVTRNVELDVRETGRRDAGPGGPLAFEATGVIKRKWFGMEFNLPIDVVADEVKVSASVQVFQATA